jgi:pimeloyl-ACP methyl ester carboxylesterase
MADGLQIVATFWPGEGETPRPALIALHIIDGRRQSWQYFAPRLNERGYSVLAIDMRGDGQTGGQMDWVMTQADLPQVYRYLIARPDVDPRRIGFIGSSIGANLALVTAAAEPAVKTLVLLSPSLNYEEVTTPAAIEAYGDRPVLMVASKEDGYSVESIEQLRELAGGKVRVQYYEGIGHSTRMLDRSRPLEDLILDWLDETLAPRIDE